MLRLFKNSGMIHYVVPRYQPLSLKGLYLQGYGVGVTAGPPLSVCLYHMSLPFPEPINARAKLCCQSLKSDISVTPLEPWKLIIVLLLRVTLMAGGSCCVYGCYEGGMLLAVCSFI